MVKIFNREIIIFSLMFFIVIFFDQAIKWFFVVTNYNLDASPISLVLTYNSGVAFSMFSSLGENLKFVQVGLLFFMLFYLVYEKKILKEYYIEVGAIFGAGVSNLLDRFIHGGVVDYIFWHKWFNFAIFNFADVVINLSVFVIILKSLFLRTQR